MEKIVLVIIAVVLTTITVMSQDFRETTWGMSPSQVKSSELNEPIEETSELLIYQTTLAGFEVYVGYFFVENKLTRARYFIAEIHLNDNDYISDYHFLNDLLKKKYGEPLEDETLWKTDSPFKSDKSFWGHCVREGDLIFYSVYRTPKTRIEIVLASEDYEIANIIEYSSTNDELKNIEEEKILKGF